MIQNNEVSISVNNLSKRYKIYNDPKDRLKEALHPTGKKYHREFYALNDVNFEIEKGQAIGIIGKNGSGKSTLLKMITGVLHPSGGTIKVNGKVAALLELGAGFNPELSGIENIYLNGTIMGFSKREMDSKIKDITDFADIGDFVNQPVKTYSSGMFARLAFAVAVSVEPDILIVDEALSVGDMYFQAKCITKMKEMASNCTILFVSHSMDMVKSFCQKAILLNEGRVLQQGLVKDVAQTYENMINQEAANARKTVSLENYVNDQKLQTSQNSIVEEDVEFKKTADQFRSGTGGAKFLRAELLINGEAVTNVPFGSMVTLRLLAQYYENVETEGTIGYMVRNHNGVDIFGMNIYNKALTLPPAQKGQLLDVRFSFKNLLSESGKYTISIGLKPKPFEPVYLDNVSIAVVFEVPKIENNYVPGLIFVDNNIEYDIISDN